MKKNFPVLTLLLLTLILSSGGCGCDEDSNAKVDSNVKIVEVQYKDRYKEFSPYDLWTASELREKYEEAEKHSSSKREILQKRIVLEGKIERVEEGTLLTFPRVQIIYNDTSDVVDSVLFGGITYRTWCYFSYHENMDRFKINGWLIIEGQINGDDEIKNCKVIAALSPEDISTLSPEERSRLGF